MFKSTARLARAFMPFILCCFTTFSANANDTSNDAVHGRSAGCGIFHAGSGSFLPMEIHLPDADRTYHLRLPDNYDPNRAYPLVFRWHGYGGDGLSGGMDIEYYSGNDAIVVGADGINKYWSPSADSVNLLFFDRMLETISGRYCIDLDRVFSYGFSAGGFFSNFLACERGDVLHANAVVAGGLRGGRRRDKMANWLLGTLGARAAVPEGGNCKSKVATWFLHDLNDDTVPIAKGKDALERALFLNGCSAKTIDDGDGCVRYQGCQTAPVVWCQSSGFGHNIRGDFAPKRVWRFFKDLP